MSGIGSLISYLNTCGQNRQDFLDHDHIRTTDSRMIPHNIAEILKTFSDDFAAVQSSVEKLRIGNFDTTDPLIAKYAWYKSQPLPESQKLWNFIAGDTTVAMPNCVNFLKDMTRSDAVLAASHLETTLKPELYDLFFSLMSKMLYPRKELAFHVSIGCKVASYMNYFRRTYTFTLRKNREQRYARKKEVSLAGFTEMWVEHDSLSDLYSKEKHKIGKLKLFSQIMWFLLIGCDRAIRNPGTRMVIVPYA